MDIRIQETGAVVTENQFRASFPNTSIPAQLNAEILADNGADEVHYAPAPVVPPTQIAAADGAELVNGRWQTKWVVSDLPAAEGASRLAEARAATWERIKAERDRRKSLGVQAGGHWFHSDADSRIQQLGLVMMGAGLPSGLLWKTLTGDFVLMTQALAGQIFAATAASDQTVFAVAEQHRAAIMESADPTAYDYFTGWPAGFGT